jgi:hypothetical protein
MSEQPALTFESALSARIAAMADACTQCGKCFEVCPITEAAGVADAEPRAVLAGVVDILRQGEGNEAARTWASACLLSGECIKPAITASIPALCWRWRGPPWRARQTNRGSSAKWGSTVSARSRAT